MSEIASRFTANIASLNAEDRSPPRGYTPARAGGQPSALQPYVTEFERCAVALDAPPLGCLAALAAPTDGFMSSPERCASPDLQVLGGPKGWAPLRGHHPQGPPPPVKAGPHTFYHAHQCFFLSEQGGLAVDGEGEADPETAPSSLQALQLLAATTMPAEEEAPTIGGPRSATPALLKRRGALPPTAPSSYPYAAFESLYGPYFEVMPRQRSSLITPAAGRRGTPAQGARRATPDVNSSPGRSAASLVFNSPNEQRTLLELCEATRSGCRNFAAEWRSLVAMEARTLRAIGCRALLMDKLAAEFAEFVTPIAQRLIEERNHVFSSRTHKPIEGFPHVHLVSGVIFVSATTEGRVALYGSGEAAMKAAGNELRAVRVVRGAPTIDALATPLCATITVMGHRVVASAPMPLRSTQDIVYGMQPSPTQRYFTRTNFAVHVAYEIGELLALAQHALPVAPPSGGLTLGGTTSLDQSQNPSSPTRAPQHPEVTLPADTKLVFSPSDGCCWLLDAARIMPPAACDIASSRSRVKDDTTGKFLCRHPVENEYNAHLYALFRPEFMRMCAVGSTSPDGALRSQPRSGHDHIGFMISTLFTSALPAALAELLALEGKGKLTLAAIGPALHANGVNLRYLGRLYQDVDNVLTRSTEVREQVRRKIALEIAARTFKAVLRRRLAAELRYRKEDASTIGLVQQLLFCSPNSDDFWETEMRPAMERKFGLFVRPVHTVAVVTEAAEESVFDGNTLRVYRTLGNLGKWRVEKPKSEVHWCDVGADQRVIDLETTVEAQRQQHTDVLFPLLGLNASLNAALLLRTQELSGFELAADMRGKKVICTFLARTRPCTALQYSQTVAALLQHCTPNMREMLAQVQDPPELKAAVEAASRAEIAQFNKIAESDSRAVMAIRLLCLAISHRGNTFPPTIPHRLLDLRKVVPSEIVGAMTYFDVAEAFFHCGKYDRCETALSDAMTSLFQFAATSINQQHGNVHPVLYARMLGRSGQMFATMEFAEGRRPSAEAAQRVLSYLRYAAYLAETCHLGILPQLLFQIAEFRKKCNAFTGSAWQSEFDRVSGTASRAQTLGGTLRRLGQTKRKQEKTKRSSVDEAGAGDEGDAFVRKQLPPVDDIMLPADKAAYTAAGGTFPSALLGDMLTPADFVKALAGSGSSVSIEQLPLDMQHLYHRSAHLTSSLPMPRAAGSTNLGEAWLALGIATQDSTRTEAGVADLVSLLGPTSKRTILAELQLIDVLLQCADVQCAYTGPSKDAAFVLEADKVLRSTLAKVLTVAGCGSKYRQELQLMLQKADQICAIYAALPAAKREDSLRQTVLDALPVAIGPTHALMKGVYDSARRYYSQLAAGRKDQAAKYTALTSAAQLAVQWLECAVELPECGEEIATHLSHFCDELVRPLRSGNHIERAAAWSLYARSGAILRDSAFIKDPKIVAALEQMDSVFRSQLRVVEQSERKAMLVREISECAHAMHSAARRVMRHSNRMDRYCAIQVETIEELGRRIGTLTAGVRDDDVLLRAQDAMQYHDEVLRVRNQAILRREAETDAALSIAVNNRKSTNEGDGADDGDAAAGDGSDVAHARRPSISGGGASSPGRQHAARAYQSPYACLSAPGDVALKPQSRGVAGSEGRLASSRGTTPSGPSTPAVNSVGFLPQLRLQDSTIYQVARLLPQTKAALVSKNQNPIRNL